MTSPTQTRTCWCEEAEGHALTLPGMAPPQLPGGRCPRCALPCQTPQCRNYSEPHNNGFCKECQP